MIRPCPLCDHAGSSTPAFPYETRWSGRSFGFVECAGCGCTYVDPVPTPDELDRMYAPGAYHDVHYSDDAPERFAESLNFLEQHVAAKTPLRVLDFGCGVGSFLRACHARGHEAVGVEHSDAAARALSASTGLDVASLETRLQRGEVFDVVHLGDVLEHLLDPAATFRSLEQLLAPNGRFFVEGPLQANASVVYFLAAAVGRTKRSLGRFVPGSDAPTHLVLATARSQREFFSHRLGYSVGAFEIDEDGWPYLNRGADQHSARARIRRSLGTLAVAAARAPIANGVLGNRFRTIVTAQRSAVPRAERTADAR